MPIVAAGKRSRRSEMPYFPTPGVWEKTGGTERIWDIFSRLLRDRIIFIGWPIDDLAASYIIAQILYLQLENKEQDISLYINSPYGYAPAGLAIYDTVQFVTNEIATYCIGEAVGVSAILLACGTKGKRYSLPNSRIMIHQPAHAWQGTASDIRVHAQEVVRLKKKWLALLSKHSGQTTERIERDVDRDFFMTPQDALDYGLIDEILQPAEAKGDK